MTAIIIGLTGPAGSGKDTFASFLRGFQPYSLAGPIRDGLCAMFGLQPYELTDRDLKERVIPRIGRSPRQLMQTLGTEWGRQHVSSDIWLRLMLRQWEELQRLALHPCMVVTDVRFDNEASAIIGVGGTVWRVTRDVAPVTRHTSEMGVSTALIKGVIANNGSLNDLRGQCDAMLKILEVGV